MENKITELKDGLFYTPRHAMETVSDETVKKADEFCEGYKAYMDYAKIERESVEFFVAEAEERGYAEFDRTKTYNAGDKVYYNNRESLSSSVLSAREALRTA